MSQNQELANELHKPIARIFQRCKVYSTYQDNIWGVDLSDMQLLSKYNNRVRFLLCVINIYSKYAWAVPLKAKIDITITSAFQKIFGRV